MRDRVIAIAAIALLVILAVPLLFGVAAGWIHVVDDPPSTACVQFTAAADQVVGFTRSLAVASQRAASAAAAKNTDRLTAATVHLELLANSFHDLSANYTKTEAACLGEGAS